jgi:NADP-dependent 3-hydroxy acid dehydrogenase YdfG
VKRTILIAGYGPGISEAVARKFGAEGFRVALVARNRDRVTEGAAALEKDGVTAKGFACDVSDPAAVTALVADVKRLLGPLTVIHWNVYTAAAGDLTSAAPTDVRIPFDAGVTGLVAATQAALPDMRGQEGAAILVTGGGFAFYDEKVDAMAVQFNAMGIAVTKAAQHKLVGLLHAKLAGDGIFVGEVVVLGVVKGTAFDRGQGTLSASDVADRFWNLYRDKDATSVSFAG